MKTALRLFGLLLSCSAALAGGFPPVTFTKIPLPEPRNVSPCGLGAGSGGKIWFTDPFFLQAGYVAPDGSITKFKLVDPASPNNFVIPLCHIVEGSDGAAYF